MTRNSFSCEMADTCKLQRSRNRVSIEFSCSILFGHDATSGTRRPEPYRRASLSYKARKRSDRLPPWATRMPRCRTLATTRRVRDSSSRNGEQLVAAGGGAYSFYFKLWRRAAACLFSSLTAGSPPAQERRHLLVLGHLHGCAAHGRLCPLFFRENHGRGGESL